MPSERHLAKWMTRVYGLLLWAYPATFRRRFGEDMRLIFRDLCRDTLAESGKVGLLLLVLHTLLDLTTSALREQLLAIGYSGANQMDTSKFDSQVVSTFELFTKMLRAGYSVKQAMQFIADRAPEPTASYLKQMVADWDGGAGFDTAATNLQSKLQSPHFATFITLMQRQREEGGNLADKLDALLPDIKTTVGRDGWSAAIDFSDDSASNN